MAEMNEKTVGPHAVAFRRATTSDYTSLGEVMFDAVRNGHSEYIEVQREAWVPVPRSGNQWSARLDSQFVIVAELIAENIGFMSLAEGGYLDFAYVRPGYQGRGIFRTMFGLIEAESRRQGLSRLWVHVSLNAVGAFAALGFTEVRQEMVMIGDVELARFEMEKILSE